MQKSIAIAGGCGFVGQYLCKDLLAKNYELVLLDIAPLPLTLVDLPNLTYRKIDLTDFTSISKVLEEFHPIAVINISGWGMSGTDMLSQKCFTINVEGTKNLVEACIANDIEYFIHTSTYNTVFHGKPIVNGSESIPYAPNEAHLDCYSHSKALSEQYVLQQNGRSCKNEEKKLKVSCIRPAAIYGEGEMRHMPRILFHIDSNAFMFKIGQATVDWVHVENLSLSYVLLLEKMMVVAEATTRPCGVAYCVSDGSPIENFEFLRPLCLVRGKAFPSITIPTALLMTVSHVMETLYHLTGMPPLLTRAEVAKVGVTHYFSMRNAQEDFGYVPKVNSQEGGERLARYYATFPDNNYFEIVQWYWYAAIAFGMLSLYIVAFLINDNPSDLHSNGWKAHTLFVSLEWLGLLIFRSRVHLRLVFVLACVIHLCEAIIAMYLAYQHFPNQVLLWSVQTLLLGFPSLSLIFARIDRTAAAQKKRQ